MQTIKIKPTSIFSFKFTAALTLILSIINICLWTTNNTKNLFTGYTINPEATMKMITSVSFIILASLYFVKNNFYIRLLIGLGIAIQLIQIMVIALNVNLPAFFSTSAEVAILMFILSYSSFYYVKVNRKKIHFLTLNSIVYLIASFAVFYYLMNLNELNFIGFNTLSWNTSMLFFINSISLYELKLFKKIEDIYKNPLTLKKTHPYHYFPFFFLLPILVTITLSLLTYLNVLNSVNSIFIIILFLSITILISMFLYTYRFIDFYKEISTNTKKIHFSNLKLNLLNKELKSTNIYLEDFAQITSHNLREPIIALNQLCKFYDESIQNDHFSKAEIEDLFRNNIQNLNLGLNALIQYHRFIKDVNKKIPQKISISDSMEKTYKKLEYLKPVGTILKSEIKSNINLPKSHIDNIFNSLFTNSFKFKKSFEELKIQILAYKTKNYYNIFYRDNGIGIDMETHKDELFKQGKRFHTESGPSNGYGLYYLKLYVTKLDGQIDLYSKVEKGTVFRIKIAC
jgi:signal transduction histidine kinase